MLLELFWKLLSLEVNAAWTLWLPEVNEFNWIGWSSAIPWLFSLAMFVALI